MLQPKRITTSPAGKWAGTEYSTIDSWNLGCKLFVVLYVDHFGLHSADGAFLYDLPIGASAEPRWSRSDPNILYHHAGNTMYEYNVATRNGGVLHEFTGYSEVSGKGEGDISRNSMALYADGYAFLYNLASGVKGPTLSTRGYSVESLYTIDGMILVSWGEKGTERYKGMELFDAASTMRFIRQIEAVNGHKSVGHDVDGSPIMVWTNSDQADADPACENGIEKVNILTGERKCLLSLAWSLAVHVSCGPGFAIVETYSAPGSPPVPYQDAILRVPYDGSPVEELCKHGSKITSYTAQPKATLSGDGTKVLYSSNVAAPNRPDYCDVYLIDLQPQAVAIPPSPEIPSPPGGSRTYGGGRGHRGKIH